MRGDAALRELARDEGLEIVIRGTCMAPLIEDGERVRIVPARFYWPGDVVVFRGADGRLTAHRLLGYRPRSGGLALVTRGDACVVHDAPVPLAAVLGRAQGARPSIAVRLSSLFRFLGLVLARLGRR
ncbi:MAG TPA: S24/S26 family peptidase [Thermoanaerobaculia bacterium]|nr:S24/S26 family peptidase [Thermoanaerobaculia bacterium]